MNNYETLEQCQGAAITGACCYRQYSLKVEDVIDSAQNEEFGCKVSDNILVLSFWKKQHEYTQITDFSKYLLISKNKSWTDFLFFLTFQLLLSQTTQKIYFEMSVVEMSVVWDELRLSDIES